MRTVQITMDPQLLGKLDEAVKRACTTRSALIRRIVEAHLRSLLAERLDRDCVEAYRRRPVRAGEFPSGREPGWDFGDRW